MPETVTRSVVRLRRRAGAGLPPAGGPARGRSTGGAAGRPRPPRPVLRRLPQREAADRRPAARPGRRRAHRGGRCDLGEGGAQAAQRRDAAPRTQPARRAGDRRVRRLARDRARRRGRGASESGPPRGPPPEPVRVRQRHPRPAGAGDRSRDAAAARRVGPRPRQHRRGALDVADAAAAVPGGGAQDQPAGRRRSDDRSRASRPSTSRAACGRTSA